jgi:hypothetical protein
MRDAECRPPEGTPDGTVCVLVHAGVPKGVKAKWRDGAWNWPLTSVSGQSRYCPEELAANGWRLATPPEDAK